MVDTLFIGGITSSTPKPFGTKETNSFFPPKSNDDKDDDGEAMEVDENGKIVKNAEKDDKEQPVEGQDLSQLFEEKDPKVPPTENVIAPTKDVADKNNAYCGKNFHPLLTAFFSLAPRYHVW